ncbi:MAG: sulfite exporter TauE/SafE family protein [Candidatus Saccharimonadales bacterium]
MKTDVILLLVGIIGGIINAIAGGGGILMFPALLAIGLPAIVANATTSLVVWPGALSSAYGYRKELRKIPGYYLLLLIPALCGSVIGSFILVHTKNQAFEQMAPWLVLFAVILLALQPTIHHYVLSRAGKKLNRHPTRVVLSIGLLVLPLAIYGGYFGVGYGIMVLALLGFTNLKNSHQMNGLKNISGAVIALFSTSYFALHHLISWRAGIAMAIGTAIGGICGARIALKTPVKLVHRLTVAIGLTVAIYLLFNSYR